MKQDVHCYGEIKIDKIWYTYNQGKFERNYFVFSQMGGEMGGEKNEAIKPIAKSKGLELRKIVGVITDRFITFFIENLYIRTFATTIIE